MPHEENVTALSRRTESDNYHQRLQNCLHIFYADEISRSELIDHAIIILEWW
jgi:hypothetical protein